ncbi:MAG: hypothetical protein Q4C25_01260 [Bacillota bacterium]|nr:hypothetical protein [Bacillota bacterium]
MRKTKMPAKGIVIRVLLLIGFCVMEFPGVLFFKDIAEPRIFGLPFAYGIMLIGWVYMCIILFWAYKCNWGEDVKKGGDDK